MDHFCEKFDQDQHFLFQPAHRAQEKAAGKVGKIDYSLKNTMRDGGTTALRTADTVDSVDTADMAYTVNMVRVTKSENFPDSKIFVAKTFRIKRVNRVNFQIRNKCA